VPCSNCHSDAIALVPAEVRLFRNPLRILAHPPMTPSPDIHVCLDCGFSEFSIPRQWLAAGWLRSLRPAPPPVRATAAQPHSVAVMPIRL